MKYIDDDDIKHMHDDEMERIFTNEVEHISFLQNVQERSGYIKMNTNCFCIVKVYENNDICSSFLFLLEQYVQREFEYCQMFFRYLKTKFDNEIKLQILKTSKIPIS